MLAYKIFYQNLYIEVSGIQYSTSNKDENGGMKPMQCETSCCGSEMEGRKFLTAEEKVEKLQDYKKWLESEAKGVEEAIKKLKKAH